MHIIAYIVLITILVVNKSSVSEESRSQPHSPSRLWDSIQLYPGGLNKLFWLLRILTRIVAPQIPPFSCQRTKFIPAQPTTSSHSQLNLRTVLSHFIHNATTLSLALFDTAHFSSQRDLTFEDT